MLISLAATVLSGVRQRRRELAVLKVLALTQRQVRAIIAWQTSTILFIAVALGVLPVTVIPLAALLLGALALLIIGNALTATPAVVASRTPTSTALRAE
jgi:ABC-type antimicrobial peptide transport system permease subunit